MSQVATNNKVESEVESVNFELGTEKLQEYVSFQECREYARGLKLKSSNSYKKRKHESRYPSNPVQVYASEWSTWSDFLGNPSTNRKASGGGRPKTINIAIDCGNGRVKFAIDGISKVFPAKWVVTPAHVKNVTGAFVYDGKNYVMGEDVDSIGNAVEEGNTYKAGKSKALPLALIAALTYRPSLLKSAPRVDKNNDKLRKLTLNIQCLSLADAEQMERSVRDIKEFQKNGITYQVDIEEFSHLVEGYGAAIIANRLMNEKKEADQDQFYILDCGFGTITLTPYLMTDGEEPSASLQRPGRGGGVSSLRDCFAETCTIGDGNAQGSARFKKLLKLLEGSYVEAKEDSEKPFSYHTRVGRNCKDDVGGSLKQAFDLWASDVAAAVYTLERVDQLLVDGRYIFCCGGGFEIETFAHYMEEEFKQFNDQFTILPSPGTIALTGLTNQ